VQCFGPSDGSFNFQDEDDVQQPAQDDVQQPVPHKKKKLKKEKETLVATRVECLTAKKHFPFWKNTTKQSTPLYGSTGWKTWCLRTYTEANWENSDLQVCGKLLFVIY
jgi:hypothetical protein